MVSQCKITKTRIVFDRALRALPITQHNRIWPLYLKFVTEHDIPETAVRIYRRYLKVHTMNYFIILRSSLYPIIIIIIIIVRMQLCPEDTEDYIEYLKGIERLDEAALKLAEVVNNLKFVSKKGKSNHQLWNELCDLISENPDKVK